LLFSLVVALFRGSAVVSFSVLATNRSIEVVKNRIDEGRTVVCMGVPCHNANLDGIVNRQSKQTLAEESFNSKPAS
jgi:hypothetical protein